MTGEPPVGNSIRCHSPSTREPRKPLYLVLTSTEAALNAYFIKSWHLQGYVYLSDDCRLWLQMLRMCRASFELVSRDNFRAAQSSAQLQSLPKKLNECLHAVTWSLMLPWLLCWLKFNFRCYLPVLMQNILDAS